MGLIDQVLGQIHVMLEKWDPLDHPRDMKGRFIPAGTPGAGESGVRGAKAEMMVAIRRGESLSKTDVIALAGKYGAHPTATNHALKMLEKADRIIASVLRDAPDPERTDFSGLYKLGGRDFVEHLVGHHRGRLVPIKDELPPSTKDSIDLTKLPGAEAKAGVRAAKAVILATLMRGDTKSKTDLIDLAGALSAHPTAVGHSYASLAKADRLIKESLAKGEEPDMASLKKLGGEEFVKALVDHHKGAGVTSGGGTEPLTPVPATTPRKTPARPKKPAATSEPKPPEPTKPPEPVAPDPDAARKAVMATIKEAAAGKRKITADDLVAKHGIDWHEAMEHLKDAAADRIHERAHAGMPTDPRYLASDFGLPETVARDIYARETALPSAPWGSGSGVGKPKDMKFDYAEKWIRIKTAKGLTLRPDELIGAPFYLKAEDAGTLLFMAAERRVSTLKKMGRMPEVDKIVADFGISHERATEAITGIKYEPPKSAKVSGKRPTPSGTDPVQWEIRETAIGGKVAVAMDDFEKLSATNLSRLKLDGHFSGRTAEWGRLKTETIEKARVTVAIGGRVLNDIILPGDKELKSTWDLAGSTEDHKGGSYRRTRDLAERKMGNRELNAVYGSMQVPGENIGRPTAYGGVMLVMTKDVTKRTTFTPADSFTWNYTGDHRRHMYTGEDAATVLAAKRMAAEGRSAPSDIHGTSYHEAQIYGGIKVDRDVEMAYVPSSTKYDYYARSESVALFDQVAKKLEAQGVKVVRYDPPPLKYGSW